MELSEAKELLSLCVKLESDGEDPRDKELTWIFKSSEVATGYFGATQSVKIYRYDPNGVGIGAPIAQFYQDEANELRRYGRYV